MAANFTTTPITFDFFGKNMSDAYCELIIDKKGQIKSTDSTTPTIKLIKEQILEDKKYGNFTPSNGKYFTFRVYGEDKEIKHKTVVKAVHYALKRWTIHTRAKVKRARQNESPDFRIYFKNPTTDSILKKNTIMYHYYPISDLNNDNRGVCVINSDFYFTTHGKYISMHLIDPITFPKETGAIKKTMDIDAILSHEFGHGWGLPHDEIIHTVMYYLEGGMAEFPEKRDIVRMQAKLGVSLLSKYLILRWINWLIIRSDNY